MRSSTDDGGRRLRFGFGKTKLSRVHENAVVGVSLYACAFAILGMGAAVAQDAAPSLPTVTIDPPRVARSAPTRASRARAATGPDRKSVV